MILIDNREANASEPTFSLFGSENQANDRGDQERDSQENDPARGIPQRAQQILPQQQGQRSHSRNCRPVSFRKTSLRLGRLRVTFWTFTGRLSSSRRHSP